MALYVVTVDLTDPRVSLHVAAGGPDPDGPGPWETTLAKVSEVAKREGFDLAVNGGFFSVRDEQIVMGRRVHYFEGNPANVIGTAISDGRIWSDEPRHPLLVIGEDGRAVIDAFLTAPEGSRQAIAGNVMLLRAGQPVPSRNTARHPRTAVGIDAEGKTLTILVVDGRRQGHSIGMTYAELAAEFQRLGCHHAMNLDGGGSTTLVMRDESGRFRVINRPSDGSELAVPMSIERPTASAIGIRIERDD